jgi:heme/copper-type cytochrome/quinol oxidase subunit 3
MTAIAGTATPLALPAGDRELPARSMVLGALVAGAAGHALIFTLAAAYLGLRAASGSWLPDDFEIDGFLGVMLTLTAVMSAPFAIWALVSDARGQRRQASTALSLTAFVGICLLNGIWYYGAELGLGAASSTYAAATYAFLGVIGAFVAAGVIGLLAALAKVAGRQTGPIFPGVVRAACWFWMTALVAWLVVWSVLFLVK